MLWPFLLRLIHFARNGNKITGEENKEIGNLPEVSGYYWQLDVAC